MYTYPTYSVAIRTLGTAGEKYLETLNSCKRQILQPEKILVYIPFGYALPPETIGKEEYIRCDKGMISQRSLPFDEISSEYILFLDDDMSFGDDLVKILFDGLLANNGDCIAPDSFKNHSVGFAVKVLQFFCGTRPHRNSEWAFIIRNDAHFSYNSNPGDSVCMTQSSSGSCILCKKSVYKAIHFDDERWLEKISYALGDDQLFVYKIFKYGYKPLISYGAHIEHLDARQGHLANRTSMIFAQGFCNYSIWYRTILQLSQNRKEKLRSQLSFVISILLIAPVMFAVAIKYRSIKCFISYYQGIWSARHFVRSDNYLNIPDFMDWKK